MALKKVIAICQSGGNFETGKDDSMSYIGGEAYAIDLDAQSQLSHFKEELAEMFQYNVDSLSVKYFLPGNRKTLITISRDKDLQRMVNFFEESGQVELFILSKEGTSQDVVNTPLIRYLQSDALDVLNIFLLLYWEISVELLSNTVTPYPLNYYN